MQRDKPTEARTNHQVKEEMAKAQVLSVAAPPSLNPTQTSENKELEKKKPSQP